MGEGKNGRREEGKKGRREEGKKGRRGWGYPGIHYGGGLVGKFHFPEQ
jgi:hypothetical protein